MTEALSSVTVPLGSVAEALSSVTVPFGSATEALSSVTLPLGSVTEALSSVTLPLGSVAEALSSVTLPLGSATMVVSKNDGANVWLKEGNKNGGFTTFWRVRALSRPFGMLRQLYHPDVSCPAHRVYAPPCALPYGRVNRFYLQWRVSRSHRQKTALFPVAWGLFFCAEASWGNRSGERLPKIHNSGHISMRGLLPVLKKKYTLPCLHVGFATQTL